MKLISLMCLALSVPLLAAESPRTFPLWDGKETVESYAKRVGLPATKSIDLGGGVKLELVLIPAGQFIMGSAEPAPPSVTVAGAEWMIGLGGAATVLLLLALVVQCVKKRKLAFSLRTLLLITAATGLCLGGVARRILALREAARYESELTRYRESFYNENPAHSITLTQPFYMGKYAVTQGQYTVLTGKNPSHFTGTLLPVENISWNDTTQFLEQLNGVLTDKSFKACLPSEAQWEFACRAGTQTRFYSGDLKSNFEEVGWNEANSGGTTHPVGQKKANMFGLYDMHGNVWQWCQDFWDEDYYRSSPARDPKGPPQGDAGNGTNRPIMAGNGDPHVIRGGTYKGYWMNGRSARRTGGRADLRIDFLGFRVILAPSD